MTPIRAGDEVRVFSRRRGGNDSEPGVIVKVGRTLVEVRWHGHVEKFRIGRRFTLDQIEALAEVARTFTDAKEA